MQTREYGYFGLSKKILKIHFNFREETKDFAKEKVEEVKKRTNCHYGGLLREYLIQREGLNPYEPKRFRKLKKHFGWYYFNDEERKIELNMEIDGLGFEMKIKTKKNIPLEERFNFKELREFILYGKTKKV